jgi:hypothetical protein
MREEEMSFSRVQDERETERETFLINQKNIKKEEIFQRHEANEKQDEMIFLEHAAKKKNLFESFFSVSEKRKRCYQL